MSRQMKHIPCYFIVCFNGNSTVIKSDGTQMYMRDLKMGDEVLVAYQSSDGGITLGYSRLLALDIYQKWDTSSSVDYLEIHTEKQNNGRPLFITGTHSLLVRKKHHSKNEYLFASEVETGDYLYLTTNDYQSAIEVQVIQINNVKQFDAYAPLTFEGNIVVNNRIASCYGTFSHSVGHLVKMPRRYLLHYYLNFKYIILSYTRSDRILSDLTSGVTKVASEETKLAQQKSEFCRQISIPNHYEETNAAPNEAQQIESPTIDKIPVTPQHSTAFDRQILRTDEL